MEKKNRVEQTALFSVDRKFLYRGVLYRPEETIELTQAQLQEEAAKGVVHTKGRRKDENGRFVTKVIKTAPSSPVLNHCSPLNMLAQDAYDEFCREHAGEDGKPAKKEIQEKPEDEAGAAKKEPAKALPDDPKNRPPKTEAQEKEELRAEIKALGGDFHPNWGVTKLREEAIKLRKEKGK